MNALNIWLELYTVMSEAIGVEKHMQALMNEHGW